MDSWSNMFDPPIVQIAPKAEGRKVFKPWKYYTHQGISQPMHYWAEKAGISVCSMYDRLRAGMTFEEALTKSKRKYK